MGTDMHTASLFPGSNGLEAAMAVDAPAVCPINVDGQEILAHHPVASGA